MALFTDEILNDGFSLQRYENSILSLSSTEAIDISAKATLAQQEIAAELLLFLDRSSLQDPMYLIRRWVTVSDVVATDPLRTWHAYKTLALIYRDAYNNQLNDRYQGKWKEYEKLSATASERLFGVGVGIVNQPIPKASVPTLNVIPKPVTGTSYFLKVSWLNQSLQEGCVSDVVEVTTNDGSAAAVGTIPSPAIVFWNVYAGSSPDEVELQNALPIPVGDTWILPSSGLIQGRPPGTGQSPERWLVDRHILPRG